MSQADSSTDAPTIAIVGAGPGLGLAIADEFGRRGFRVALLARTQSKLDELVEVLAERQIEAAGFSADLMDRPSLAEAFARVKQRFGRVDVLEYSPANPDLAAVGVLESTPEAMQPYIEHYLYGAIAAAQQVLPDMLAAGSGTLLFTTGGGSIDPAPSRGNANAAAAALRNWAMNLHGALKGTGVYAAHVALFAWLRSGQPGTAFGDIAPTYWNLHEARDVAEIVYKPAP